MLRQKNSVASEYARLAAQYDTRWSQYVTATVTETLLRLPTNPPRRVLDVACGTGSLLVPLLGKYPNASLIGVDLTPEMLEGARRKLPDRVALVSADAEQLPFSSQYFDLVISANSFHYFWRPRQALREFHRVLTPHGSLVITDWCNARYPGWEKFPELDTPQESKPCHEGQKIENHADNHRFRSPTGVGV